MARGRSVTPSSTPPRSTPRVATKTISEVMSPLEHIALKLKEIRPPG
jgi:hypothetical protein